MSIGEFLEKYIAEPIANFIDRLLSRQGKPQETTDEIIKRLEAKRDAAPPSQPSQPSQSKKSSPPPPPPSKVFVLDIKSEDDWAAYVAKLRDFGKLGEFIDGIAPDSKLKWCKSVLGKAQQDVNDKLKKPGDFSDDRVTENLAYFAVKSAQKWVGALQACARENEKPGSNHADYEKLNRFIDDYFSRIGIGKKIFATGDDYNEWADLCMEGGVFVEATADKSLHNRLIKIEVQPRFLAYKNAYDEVARLYFGGSCSVYGYKAGDS